MLSKSGFYFRLKKNIKSKIENLKIAIKIKGFYLTTFDETIQDSKIENLKIAIKIDGFYQNKNKTKYMF